MNTKGLYIANSIAMLLISSVLVGAFYFQFGLNENPCPLCLLQRMGMLGIILGLSLNTYFGFKKEHFAIIILVALIGSVYSIRQILLHICPVAGEPLGYGTPILGMYLYSWALLIFATSIIGSAIFLFFIREEKNGAERNPAIFEKVVFYLGILLCFANIIAAFFECYFGPCCENGPCP